MGAEERRSGRERREEREKVERRRREGGEREEQRKRGQREVRVASRTVCPGWPRSEVGQGLRGVG